LRQLLAIAVKRFKETTAVVEKTQKAKRKIAYAIIALMPVPQGFLAFLAFVKYCFPGWKVALFIDDDPDSSLLAVVSLPASRTSEDLFSLLHGCSGFRDYANHALGGLDGPERPWRL
jgi:hypothetical protein